MNKKLILGFLSILAIVTSVIFINSVSAKNADKSNNSAFVVSTTIVISQAYGGGGGTTGTYMNDYVELHNISNSPQSLNGLSLMYGSATGQFGSSATNIFALNSAATIPAGGYYLVQLSTAGTGGIALPVTPDETTTNLSMSGTNGKVALTNGLTPNTCGATATPCTLPNAQIIDLVSWGTANNAEGGASTNGGASLTSTQGNVRKGNGCTETDNNNNDFDVVTAPVPRNSASPVVSCGGSVAPTQHVVDFNGDGKTDYAVVRNTGGGAGGQITWFVSLNGTSTTFGNQWGISTDEFVPADYDGDSKSDIAVWRPGAQSTFYILQSSNGTVRIDNFGLIGDDPSVVGDYDGDGKADVAVYREGASSGQQSTWFYRASSNNPSGNITYVPWGVNGDFPVPGDFDGDGKNDFVTQRNNGGGSAAFWMNQTTAGQTVRIFGTPSDSVVPGDYDGDGKTDIAVARASGGAISWFILRSSDSGTTFATWGTAATDFITQGDYDGDGKTDLAVWRNSTGTFWVSGSTSGASNVQFGAALDYPVANYNTH